MEIDGVIEVQARSDSIGRVKKLRIGRAADEFVKTVQGCPICVCQWIGLALFVTRMARLAEIRGVIHRLINAGVDHVVAVEGPQAKKLSVQPLHQEVNAVVSSVE